jgi:hypothetical protein
MTVKNTNVNIERNANIKSVRPLAVYDDAGLGKDGNGVVNPTVAGQVSAAEFSNGLMHRTVLTCTAVPISVADDAGVAQYGGVKLYTFPEGAVCTLGAIMTGSLTMGLTGTIIDAFTGVIALGSSTASTGATLVVGEATWLQSTAMTTAVAKVAATKALSIATQLTEAGSRWYDGTTTSGPVYLNVAIADDATHTAATGTWTGTITLTWFMLGDY